MSETDRYRRFNLRIPTELFDQLQKEADARSHSMNAEIVARLEKSLSAPSSSYGEAAIERLLLLVDKLSPLAFENMTKLLEVATRLKGNEETNPE